MMRTVPLLLALLHVCNAEYTVYDDASWAVRTTNVNFQEMGSRQKQYDDFMAACIKRFGRNRCSEEEKMRIRMNVFQTESMRNYTSLGFLKTRVPEGARKLLQKFWDDNRKAAITEKLAATYHNGWDSPTTFLNVADSKLKGGSPEFRGKVVDYIRPVMEEWAGRTSNTIIPLSLTSVYGIRVYHKDAILTPHVDRLPLVISCIINVDQDVDEPWPLEVYDNVRGTAYNVTMEPWDMVLYESHSVIHGRPFPFKGKFFANIFAHFEPLLPPSDGKDYEYVPDLPPYIIPGSVWEQDWRKENPDGWNLDPQRLAQSGELRALKYMFENEPHRITEADSAGWQPIHEAARHGYTDMVKFLVEEAKVPINSKVEQGYDATQIAKMFMGLNHPVYQYLKKQSLKQSEEL